MTSSSSREREILDVAAQLFASDGFAAVGIDEIGAAVGISGPALYRYFRGKDAILDALVAATTRAMVDGLSAFEHDASDPEALLRRTAAIALDHRAALATVFRELKRLSPRVAKQLHGPLRKLDELRELAIARFNPELDATSRELRLAATAGLLHVVMTSGTALPRPALDERLVASNMAVFRAPLARTARSSRASGWTPAARRRDVMLAAALRLMRSRGFHEVSVGEIAAEAGVPTRALYRSFVNKLDILVEARERARARIAAVCEVARTRGQTAGEVSDCLAQGLAEAVMRDVDLALVTFRERKALARAEGSGRHGVLADLEHLWSAALADARPELDPREVVLLVEMTIALIHHAADAAGDHPERVAEIGAVAEAHLRS